MQDDVKSLSHSKWRCKYHIVFAPKYRRQVIYGKIKADIGKILRELSERNGKVCNPYPCRFQKFGAKSINKKYTACHNNRLCITESNIHKAL